MDKQTTAMTDTEWKEATTPNPKTPDEQRRSRKHTTYQQHKARKVAERKEEPMLDNPQLSTSRCESPLFSPDSKRSISARRKEIIQKRIRKKSEDTVEAIKEESEKMDSSWLNASMEESIEKVEAVELGMSEEVMDGVTDKHPPMSKKGWKELSPEPDASNVHLENKVSLEESFERVNDDETNVQLKVREESIDEDEGGDITNKRAPQSNEAMGQELSGDVDVTDKPSPTSNEIKESLEEREGSTGQDVLVGREATDNRLLLSDEASEDLGERVESIREEVLVGGLVTDIRPLLSDEANVKLGEREESIGEDVGVVLTDKRPPLADEVDENLGEREESTGEDEVGEVPDKLPSLSDEENVKLGGREESMGENLDNVPRLSEKSWDTRSILEHPPELLVDPSWDTSKVHFDSNTEEPYTFKDMNKEIDGIFKFDSNLDISGIDMVDMESWAKTDMTFPSMPHVDIEQEFLVQSSEKDVSVKDEDKETTLANDIFAENSFETFEAASIEAALLMKGADVKDVNSSMDVNVGCYSFNATLHASKDDDESLAPDHTNTVLNDNEELLALDQVRSDVDGPNFTEGDKMLNQVAKQKRIDQYEENDNDPTSDNEGDEADSNEENFADEEEIQYVLAENGEEDEHANSHDENFAKEDEFHYISADSSEEYELAAQITINSIAVPENVGGSVQADRFETFSAAAAAALGANGKSSRVGSSATREGSRQLENIELFHTKSSTSSGKARSTLMDYSVASSTTFFAEGLLSPFVTSVKKEAASTLATAQGIAMPPPGSQTPKSSNNRSAQSAPLLKFPPPPPEKLKKWQEEKMRPMKHRQSVAKAKAALAERNSGQKQIAQSDGGIPFVTSFSNSQDEIETAISECSVHKNSIDGSNVENEGARSDTLTDINEAAPIQMFIVTSPKATTGTDSFIDSPPPVTRTVLEDTSLVASSEDGVWKDDNNLKVARSLSVEKVVAPGAPNHKSFSPSKLNKSQISDSKMAERLAFASYSAARKFEEDYPDVDRVDSSEATPAPAEYLNQNPSYDEVVPPEKPVTSYFCAQDMLTASICEPYETEVVNDDDDLLHQVPSQVKGWASMEKSPDEQNRPPSIYENSFDDTHHAGLELVGGAFSTWRNSDFAHVAEINQGSLLDKAVDVAVAGVMSKQKDTAAQEAIDDVEPSEEVQLLSWLEKDVLSLPSKPGTDEAVPESDRKVDADGGAALARSKLQALLEVDEIFNSLCKYASENIVMAKSLEDSLNDSVDVPSGQTPRLHPFSISVNISKRPNCSILAANFVSFLNRTSLLSGIASPFKDENPFVLDIVTASMSGMNVSETESVRATSTMQELVFQHELGDVVGIMHFFYKACGVPSHKDDTTVRVQLEKEPDLEVTETTKAPAAAISRSLLYQVPTESPCPFETAVWNMPSIVAIVLGFLGDPVVVCRMKLVNSFCNRLIKENEHIIMRDAVRLGGISMHIRPAFWMWISLEKCGRYTPREKEGGDATADEGREKATTSKESSQDANKSSEDDAADGPLEYQSKCITVMLPELEKRGREGKWHHVIQRDVTRAFGNMPPHKTGARLRTDSIVRALVTWGRGRLIQRGVKGGGVAPPTPTIGGFQKQKSKLRAATGPPPWERGDGDADNNNSYKGPTETVAQWNGISPVPSFSGSLGCQSGQGDSVSMAQKVALASSVATALERERKPMRVKNSRAIEELALSGNTLTNEMKAGLQNQLGYILHALAAAHEDVGYCQGMDYIVAHLLRVLQDTVRYHSVRGTLCSVIGAQPEIPAADSDEQSLSTQIDQAIDSSLVVEETVFRVMDTFFTTYNLRHMYWPELRCLKTCCRVFERLIQLKLPVLADHFAYHELNVGLFALGWFQTLFLYLPSMPSATVCHMWDIWLVERSFKIFFRVGTAILFLSQPILLNHELEGMMTYLNTFPDATLLNPDILIACALQIKVTNRMLMEIEQELTGGF